MQNIHAGKQCHKNAFLICNLYHFFLFFFPIIVSQRCSPAPAEYLLSLKSLNLLAPHPKRYRVYGLQTSAPPPLFSLEREGAPPHPSCLVRKQFAAWDAVLQILAASLGGEGLKSGRCRLCIDIAARKKKEKKMASLTDIIYSLYPQAPPPLFLYPSIVYLAVFLLVLIGFVHAMQFR